MELFDVMGNPMIHGINYEINKKCMKYIVKIQPRDREEYNPVDLVEYINRINKYKILPIYIDDYVAHFRCFTMSDVDNMLNDNNDMNVPYITEIYKKRERSEDSNPFNDRCVYNIENDDVCNDNLQLTVDTPGITSIRNSLVEKRSAEKKSDIDLADEFMIDMLIPNSTSSEMKPHDYMEDSNGKYRNMIISASKNIIDIERYNDDLINEKISSKKNYKTYNILKDNRYIIDKIKKYIDRLKERTMSVK